MSFPVFDPTEGPIAKAFTLAPRAKSLAGKVVGVLDNGKANSELLLREIGTLLQTEAGVADIVLMHKESAYRPAPDEQLDALAGRVDAVVAGIGD